jgi:hypothetical protein
VACCPECDTGDDGPADRVHLCLCLLISVHRCTCLLKIRTGGYRGQCLLPHLAFPLGVIW